MMENKNGDIGDNLGTGFCQLRPGLVIGALDWEEVVANRKGKSAHSFFVLNVRLLNGCFSLGQFFLVINYGSPIVSAVSAWNLPLHRSTMRGLPHFFLSPSCRCNACARPPLFPEHVHVQFHHRAYCCISRTSHGGGEGCGITSKTDDMHCGLFHSPFRLHDELFVRAASNVFW